MSQAYDLRVSRELAINTCDGCGSRSGQGIAVPPREMVWVRPRQENRAAITCLCMTCAASLLADLMREVVG